MQTELIFITQNFIHVYPYSHNLQVVTQAVRVTGLSHLNHLSRRGHTGYFGINTGLVYFYKICLAHPNVRLFITHGGLLSTQETVDCGLPLVDIPIHADQLYSVARIVSLAIGIHLDYENITAASVTWALNEVLNNKR